MFAMQSTVIGGVKADGRASPGSVSRFSNDGEPPTIPIGLVGERGAFAMVFKGQDPEIFSLWTLGACFGKISGSLRLLSVERKQKKF